MNWTLIDRREPDFPGLYAIYLDGKLTYIGTSVHVHFRLRDHGLGMAVRCGMYKGIAFGELFVKTRKIDCNTKRLGLESALIRRLRPPANQRENNDTKIIKVSMNHTAVNLNFRKFVNDTGGQANVATLLAMSPGHVSLIYNGKRRVTIDLARRIEIATCGKYTKESLAFPERPRKPKVRMPA